MSRMTLCREPHRLLVLILVLSSPLSWGQFSGQYDACRSNLGAVPGWELYPCQPPPANMKEFMQIRVDPPGITCGNPPERFCTLVSKQVNSHGTHSERFCFLSFLLTIFMFFSFVEQVLSPTEPNRV